MSMLRRLALWVTTVPSCLVLHTWRAILASGPDHERQPEGTYFISMDFGREGLS